MILYSQHNISVLFCKQFRCYMYGGAIEPCVTEKFTAKTRMNSWWRDWTLRDGEVYSIV